MTETELKDLWARWMHRNDLTGDVDTVYDLAVQRVQERMLLPIDPADVLANAPRMLIHAGLSYLHELARDGEGQDIEDARFEQAVQDASMALSRNAHRIIDPFTFDGGSYGP